MLRKICIMGMLFTLTVLFAHPALGAGIITLEIKNNTGQAASDLEVTLAGTGGVTATVIQNQPGGCGAPTIGTSNPVVIDWGSTCVPAGATVRIRVTSPNSPIVYSSHMWTSGGNPIGGGAIDVKVLDPVPSLTTYGLIILALLLSGTAIWLFRKRLAMEKGGLA